MVLVQKGVTNGYKSGRMSKIENHEDKNGGAVISICEALSLAVDTAKKDESVAFNSEGRLVCEAIQYGSLRIAPHQEMVEKARVLLKRLVKRGVLIRWNI